MVDVHAWTQNKSHEMSLLRDEIASLDFARIISLGVSVVEALKNGQTLAFLGNGGSAAESMHLTTEFISKCLVSHTPLKALCLNESQSSITAIGNDYGFEFIFERMVRGYLRSGDILIALSTSGTSRNVVKAINAAKEVGVRVILWTGKKQCDLGGVEVWNCEVELTPRVQEIHLLWGHLLAEFVELHFVNNSR